MSKLSNNVMWAFIGLILILGGLMLYVHGYKPLVFGAGILVLFYRAVTVHTDEYEPKTKH